MGRLAIDVVRNVVASLTLTLALSTAPAWTATVDAAEVMRTAVTVRVYAPADLPVALTSAALAEAAATLKAALVDVRWVHCTPMTPHLAPPPASAAPSASAECHVPPGPGDLAMRVVRTSSPTPPVDSAPLGDALVSPGGGHAVLATVYFDRVVWLAALAGTDLSSLLGRTMAHELGHLLTASSVHARSGLMRPNWTSDEVRRNHKADWVFASADVSAMARRSTRGTSLFAPK